MSQESDADLRDKIFEDVSNAFSTEIFNPIKKIYLDWIYMQDLYIGALMSKCTSQVEYSYLINNLEKYNNRVSRECLTYFPKFNLTTKQLEEIINNDNKNSLFVTSPITNLYFNFEKLMKSVNIYNTKLSYKEPVEIFINIYPVLSVSDMIVNIIRKLMSKILTNATLNIYSKKIFELEEKELTSCDILFINRFDLFLKENTPSFNSFFAEPISKFFHNAIITPRRMDNLKVCNDTEINEEKHNQIFKDTEQFFQLMTNFYYINPIILHD